jgi:hypothetical protein
MSPRDPPGCRCRARVGMDGGCRTGAPQLLPRNSPQACGLRRRARNGRPISCAASSQARRTLPSASVSGGAAESGRNRPGLPPAGAPWRRRRGAARGLSAPLGSAHADVPCVMSYDQPMTAVPREPTLRCPSCGHGLYTVDDVAQLTGQSARTLQRRLDAGAIPGAFREPVPGGFRWL